MPTAPEQRSLPVRLLLACFVAQGAWWLLTGLVLTATLALVVRDASDETRDLMDLLVDNAIDVGGISGSLLQYVLVVTVVGGLLLLAGVFVVPMFLRIFIRMICGVRASYGWALVANLASWILLVALTLLLWLIPGAQPVALFLVWLGSSAMSAALLYPHVRGRASSATTTSSSTAAAATASTPTTAIAPVVLATAADDDPSPDTSDIERKAT